MKIYIDIGAREVKGDYSGYFISVPLSNTEVISFDNSSKGYRVMKQVLAEKKEMPANSKITAQWETIIIEDGKYVESEHVRWVDMDKFDWCNNEIWETVAESPIAEELNEKLQKYSALAKKHYNELNKFTAEMSDFEKLLNENVAYYEKLF